MEGQVQVLLEPALCLPVLSFMEGWHQARSQSMSGVGIGIGIGVRAKSGVALAGPVAPVKREDKAGQKRVTKDGSKRVPHA